MMSTFVKLPRIAIIGVSGYGRIHLQLARERQERGDLQIVAATVINPIEEAETVAWLRSIGAAIFEDYAAMLRAHAGEIDLVLIPTGIHWHARMTCAALQAGANVLVEKPLAGSMAEVAEIQAMEKRTGRFVAVGFQDLYEPGTLWLDRELAAGAIGKIQSIRFLGCWPRARSYYQRNDWAGRLRVAEAEVMDSPLNNAFAHFVMLSLYFLGNEHRMRSLRLKSVELLRAHAIESFDTGVVQAVTDDGVTLWFGASHACHQTIEPEILIEGSLGQATWKYENEAVWVRRTGEAATQRLLDITGARRAMFQATLQRLTNADTFICTSDLAARHTALIEAIHHEAAIHPVHVEQVTWQGPEGDSAQIPEIAGLPQALRQAYLDQSSLSEAGLRIQSVTT